MTISQRTVGDLVAEDYRLGATFKQFGIDFCCGGGITVKAACKKEGVNLQELQQAIEQAVQHSAGSQPDVRSWEPDFLAAYIVNVHHRYVRDSSPILLQFAQKVARVHGGGRPELIEVAQLTAELTSELEEHVTEEEEGVFAYITELVRVKKEGGAAPPSDSASIALREDEHEHAGELMRRIRELTSDYTPPTDACNTYRALFAKLEEFEEDLHRHVHLENNILFPAARDIEQELADSSAA